MGEGGGRGVSTGHGWSAAIRPMGVLAALFLNTAASSSGAHRRAEGEGVHVFGGRGVDLACLAERGATRLGLTRREDHRASEQPQQLLHVGVHLMGDPHLQ